MEAGCLWFVWWSCTERWCFCELKSNEFVQICLNPKWPLLNGRLLFSGYLLFSLAPSLSPHWWQHKNTSNSMVLVNPYSAGIDFRHQNLTSVDFRFWHLKSIPTLKRVKKWKESGFRPPLCTYRLNWARRTSWGWWDDWDDTVLQTQNSKFEPWRSEAEHATSRSRRLPTILTTEKSKTFYNDHKPII